MILRNDSKLGLLFRVDIIECAMKSQESKKGKSWKMIEQTWILACGHILVLQQRSQNQMFQHCLESEKNRVKKLAPKYGYRLKSISWPLWHNFLLNVFFPDIVWCSGYPKILSTREPKGPYFRRNINLFCGLWRHWKKTRLLWKNAKTRPFQNLASQFNKNYQNEISVQ